MIAKILDFEEGFSPVPYLCPEDYATIGLGTKLHSEKGQDPKKFLLVINRETAYVWLKREVQDVEDRILRGSNAETYKMQPRPIQHIILSMGYQLGYGGLFKLRKCGRTSTHTTMKGPLGKLLIASGPHKLPKGLLGTLRSLGYETCHPTKDS